ncbi:MAG TPA: hypothetical protein VFE54_00395 [Mucilaginibacter sp.]|jgi:hypothetical protein|nr:hypothetical protein [Mucilaginibacter sp.]
MKRLKELIIPAITAVAFILLTGYLAFNSIGWLADACFMFHLFPFGIGFSGGGGLVILIYYLVLWLVLTVLFLGIKRLITLIFKRSS